MNYSTFVLFCFCTIYGLPVKVEHDSQKALTQSHVSHKQWLADTHLQSLFDSTSESELKISKNSCPCPCLSSWNSAFVLMPRINNGGIWFSNWFTWLQSRIRSSNSLWVWVNNLIKSILRWMPFFKMIFWNLSNLVIIENIKKTCVIIH